MYLIAPNGMPIDGTLERLQARAQIVADSFELDADAFEWAGDTDVFWDGQETVERNGLTVYLDAWGNEWTREQCALTSMDPDDIEELAEELEALAQHV